MNQSARSASQLGGGTPLITVAMPIYNAGRYLRLAVLSIVKQTESNWELLIIDDGSTDNALASIRDIDDSRIRILRDGTNKGLAARLNEAIDLARGKYFARMDQDDVSYPARFAQQVHMLQVDPTLDLTATRAIMIDEDNRALALFPAVLAHREICARPWLGFYLPHPTWMGKTSWFRKYRYRVPGPYFCEDQELLLRSYCESQFATVDQILLGYRVRSKTNWRKLVRTRKTVLGIQLRHFAGTRQRVYMLMAMVTTAGRLASDFAKFIAQSLTGKRSVSLAAAQSQQWDEVLRAVSDDADWHSTGDQA